MLRIGLKQNMTFAELSSTVHCQPDGVLLLEGRRSIPEQDAVMAKKLAMYLARHFPQLRFRSGNADGTDQAFSEGVAAVDSTRLQIVAPYTSHRKAFRYADALYDSPDTMNRAQEDALAFKTITATPKNKGLIEKRSGKGAFAAKAAYLIRDTMKVVGHSEQFPKPILALFYVDLSKPEEGGTGHTIRVCRQEGVPYVFQDVWQTWISA